MSQTGQMIRLGDAVEDVGIETDIQFFGSFNQSHESIPSGDAIQTARTKADVPLANPLTDTEFGGVVVQRQVGIVQNQEQACLFGQGLGNALVKLVVAGDSSEEFMEALTQRISSGWVGRISKVVELVIENPEFFLEIGQKMLVMSHEGRELLVMATFMDPAQSLKPGKMAELGRIIREQDGNERRLGLGVVGGECSRLQDTSLLLVVEARSQFYFNPLLQLGQGDGLVKEFG